MNADERESENEIGVCSRLFAVAYSMIRRTGIIISIIIGLLLFSKLEALPNGRETTVSDISIRKSLVLVRISTIRYSAVQPWVREAGESFTTTGLVLPGRRILVLAYDIQNASLLEITKFSSYQRVIATVERQDIEANVALLSVSDGNFFQDLQPLPAGIDPAPGQEITAVKVDDVFRVYREKLFVTEINPVADFGLTYLPAVVFRTSEPFRGGGIILSSGKVAGFIGYSNQDKRAESIPPSTFETFRIRASLPVYPGFVSQGFELDSLVDPALREYFGMSENMHGALVTRVYPGTSAAGILKKEDVVTAIDGIPVDDMGFYEDSQTGRQNALMLLARNRKNTIRSPGESVALDVIRDKKPLRLSLRLLPYDGRAERIPWLTTQQPSYLIETGIVFLELSGSYLRERFGANWRTSAIELAYTFDTRHFYETPGDDRIVIIGGMLPDELNRGYENLMAAPVLEVEGRPVVNLRVMSQILDELKQKGMQSVRMTLTGGRIIFLDLQNRDAVRNRLRVRYGIPAISRF